MLLVVLALAPVKIVIVEQFRKDQFQVFAWIGVYANKELLKIPFKFLLFVYAIVNREGSFAKEVFTR